MLQNAPFSTEKSNFFWAGTQPLLQTPPSGRGSPHLTPRHLHRLDPPARHPRWATGMERLEAGPQYFSSSGQGVQLPQQTPHPVGMRNPFPTPYPLGAFGTSILSAWHLRSATGTECV